MAVMKLRSFVLVLCMLVVPALALFSHMTPPSVQQAAQQMIWTPLCETISVINATLQFDAYPSVANKDDFEHDASLGVTSSSLTNDTLSESSLSAVENTRDTSIRETLPTVTVQETRIPSTEDSERKKPRSQAEWELLASLHKKLLSFGATKLDCRPQPGTQHGYSSTCQLPMDPNGQLHRVFHGQGSSAPEAMHALIYQIQAWQVRQAGLSRKQF